MKPEKPKRTFATSVLMLAPRYYHACSEMTQMDIKTLAGVLLFTAATCGAILAASICNFLPGSTFLNFLFVFPIAFILYYALDLCIIKGTVNASGRYLKVARVAFALILGVFNSFLINNVVFREDIVSAREIYIADKRAEIDSTYQVRLSPLSNKKTRLMADVDNIELRLSSKLDSLNAEADGSGGSHKVGMDAIWKMKRRLYVEDSARWSKVIAGKIKEADAIDSIITSNETARSIEKKEAGKFVSAGLSKNMDLLHEVTWIKGTFSNKLMALLLLFISMLLELLPLIAKSFFTANEYFEIAHRKKELSLSIVRIETENALNLTNTKLVNQNAVDILREIMNFDFQKMDMNTEKARILFLKLAAALDEIESAHNGLKQKHPAHTETYIKEAYQNALALLAIGMKQTTTN